MRRPSLLLVALALLPVAACGGGVDTADAPTTAAEAPPTSATPTTLTGPAEASSILAVVDADTAQAQIDEHAQLGRDVVRALGDPAAATTAAETARRLNDIYAGRLFRWQTVEPRIQALGAPWVDAFHEVRHRDEDGIDMTKAVLACATACDTQFAYDMYMSAPAPDWRAGSATLRTLLLQGG